MNYKSFPIWLLRTSTTLDLYKCHALSTSIFLWGHFPVLSDLLSCTCWPLWIYVLFSVCSSLTSSPDLRTLSITNPTFSALLFNSRRPLHAAWVLLSAPLSENFLKTVRLAKSRAFLFACQHSGLLLLLPDAYVLKNFYFNCFICFMIVSGQS